VKLIKDFENFVKGKIEIVTDEIKDISENTKENIKNVRFVTEKVKVTVNSLDPLINSIIDFGNTTKMLIDSLNDQIKNLYIELSSLITGAKELSGSLRRIFSLSLKEKR